MKCSSDGQYSMQDVLLSVKLEFRSFQFYLRLQRDLFFTKVFVSCDFLLHDVMQHEVDNNKWPTASFITDFAN